MIQFKKWFIIFVAFVLLFVVTGIVLPTIISTTKLSLTSIILLLCLMFTIISFFIVYLIDFVFKKYQ